MTASQEWREGASTRTRRRAYWQRKLDAGAIILCGWCNKPVRPDPDKWELGHNPRYPKDHTKQSPWHKRCNRQEAQATTTAKRVASATTRTSATRPGGSVFEGTPSGTASAQSGTHTRPTAAVLEVPDVEGFGVDDPVWDAAPWLDDLREVPANATWPRLMTVPHPRAVGTLGPEFERELLVYRDLRWFQRLAAYRILEVDEIGRLVWRAWLLSMARQLGKSFLLVELALSRVRQGARFEQQQNVLHVANLMQTAAKVQKPAQRYAEEHPDEWRKWSSAGTRADVEWLQDGSVWVCRPMSNVYGDSIGLAVVDEAWEVPVASIEEGVSPTLMARNQSQLGLISTAHRKAQRLEGGVVSVFLPRRATALKHLATGERDLLIEWSAPHDADVADRSAWRMASPHWDDQREQHIAEALERAEEGVGGDEMETDPLEYIRAQYLNIWPQVVRAAKAKKGNPLVDVDAWADCELVDPPDGPLTVVIEDDRHGGAAVAAAVMRADGRVVVTGRLVSSIEEAAETAKQWMASQPGSRLLVGATMLTEPHLRPMLTGKNAVGSIELRTGLAVFRRAQRAGRLWHDEESAELTEQVGRARVVENAGGLALVPGLGAMDLLRAAVWAVQAVYDGPPEPRIW